MNPRHDGTDPKATMRRENDVSPYLKRPLRSLEEALRQRVERLPDTRRPETTPAAGNSNIPPRIFPSAKSA